MDRILYVLVAGVGVASLNGCGGNDCGSGTAERDGECVSVASAPDATVSCGSGTTLQGGECVVSDTSIPCGAGTSESDGECVPSASVCGPGTSFDSMSGECVPDSVITCGDGTSEQAGVCVPAESACGEGTSLEGGVCTPNETCGEFTVADASGSCVPAARIQIVHNSADPGAAFVDIYANGSLLVPDLAFRSATPFTKVPANVMLEIAVAPGSSSGPDDAVGTFDVEFDVGTRHYVVASGVITPEDFVEPFMTDIEFTLAVTEAQESVDSTTDFELVVFHGATDAGVVNIGQTQPDYSPTTFRGNVEFGEFTTPIEFSAGVNVVDISPDSAPFQVISARQTSVAEAFPSPVGFPAGTAALVIASGFADPSANQNGAAFDVLAVLPDGTVAPLDAAARVQVVHTVAAPEAESVEVFAVAAGTSPGRFDGFDLEFRSASRFYSLPAGVPLDFYVTPNNPTDVVAEALITVSAEILDLGSSSHVIAVGVPSGAGFDESNGNSGLALQIVGDASEAAPDNDTVTVQLFHASSDGPQVDIYLAPFLVNLEAPPTLTAEFRQGSDVLSFPVERFVAAVAAAGADPSLLDFTLDAEFFGFGGDSLFVAATGFLDPSANNDGPAFGLTAYTAGGGGIQLPAAAYLQLIHNGDDAGAVDVGIDQTLALNDVAFRSASPYITVPAGQPQDIELFPLDAGSALGDEIEATALDSVVLDLDPGEAAIVIANGLVDGDPALALDVSLDGQRFDSSDTTNVGFLVFHGGYDAPTVDVEQATDTTLVDNISYGEFAAEGYVLVPPGTYELEVTAQNGASLDPAFLRTAELGPIGERFVVVASGFLTPEVGESAFELVAYPSSGGAGAVLPAP